MSAGQRTASAVVLLGYARVSGAEQEDGTSLDAQADRFRAYAREHHLDEPRLFVEVESGGEERRESRTELDRLLVEALALAARGVAVLVAALVVDRWTRDVVAGVADVRRLLRAGVGWVAVDEGIDARTDHGYEALLQRAAGAEIERRRIRKRTVGARQRLRALGYHVEGQPPPGYALAGGRGRWKLTPDDRAPVIRQAFALAVAGRSTRQIAADLGHLPGLDHAALARRLRDRRYLGESCTVGGGRGKRAAAGEWRPTHEGIVDAATWEAAQRALDGRREGGRPVTGTSRVEAFLLRGVVRCTCGRGMRALAPMPGASTRHAGWYACPGCGLHARQDRADELAAEMVLEHLEEERDRLQGPPLEAPAAPDLSAERLRIVARMERLLGAIEAGALTAAEARPRLERARAELADVDRRRAAAEAPSRAPTAADALATVEGLRATWAGLDAGARREVLRHLAEQVEIARTGPRHARDAWELRITWAES